MIRSILQWWKWRNTPQHHLVTVHDLTILAARRCAYDLAHASSEIFMLSGGGGQHTFYEERAGMWQKIFTPADGPKTYRHHLHHEIERLEGNLERLRKANLALCELCHQNAIDIPFEVREHADDVPF